VGRVIQDIGFWILNDIIWNKTNPMPNFRGRRFTNAHETIIWAAKDKNSKYKYNYDATKSLNGDIQMRSDWNIPICTGSERVKKQNGEKSHPTQKPEALLHRILLSASEPGAIVLDPFFGTGTTGVVAKRLGRKWIGIESNKEYAKIANERILSVNEASRESIEIKQTKRDQPRIPFGNLVERGLIEPGTKLYSLKKKHFAIVKVDGSIEINNMNGSIHKLGAYVQGLESCNGWTFWHFSDGRKLHPIDMLREKIRCELSNAA
jgi:modification methylase